MLNPLLIVLSLASTGPTTASLQKDLQRVVTESDGKVGICSWSLAASEAVCINGLERFPLQSVMKLIVSAAVMDAIDQKRMKLEDLITVKPEHASPGPQEFADLVRKKGSLAVTVEELMRRSIVDSDSTSIDILIEKLGGMRTVQSFLKAKNITDIRIDRNERDLQSEFCGFPWQAAYADPQKFEATMKAVPPAKRDQALETYLKDPRDTATPLGMVKFLKALAEGKLLSRTSTEKLLSIMEMTVTGPDRLKAGLPPGWKIGHKTGTSFTWNGRAAATNDVGILTAPNAARIAIAVFVTDSRHSPDERALVIAKAAKAVTGSFAP
nr:ClassA_beta_lactamase [uncultured bacterium]AIA16540.1 ClassA_beta_lactamase [uncultured bacterium]